MFLPSRKTVLALVLIGHLAAPTPGSGQGTRAVTSRATTATTVNAVTSTVTLGGGKTVHGAQGIALNPSTGLVYIGLNGAIVSGCSGDGSVAGGTAVGMGPGAGQISVVDPARSLEVAAVASGGAPVWPTVDPERGVVYMSNSGDGTVAVHDAATGTRLSTIAIGGKPHMGGLDYSTRTMVVSNTFRSSNVTAEQIYVSVVDTRTNSITRNLTTSAAPHGVVVDQDRDLIYFSGVLTGEITVVNATTGQVVASADPNSAYGTAFGNNNMLVRQNSTRRLLQSNSQQPGNIGVLVANEVTLAAEGLIRFNENPASYVWGMWVDEPNRLLFAALPNVNAIGVADLDTLTHVATIPVGACPYAVAVDPVRRVGVSSNQGSPTATASASIFDLCPVYAAVGRTVSGCAVTNPTMAVDRTSLAFRAVSSGAAFTAQTPAQTVRLRQTGAGTVTWTAASTAPWLVVSPTSGSGSATLTISAQFAAGLAAAQTGNINLTLTGAGNTVGPIGVTLSVVSSTAAASPPFGVVDTPVGDATVLAGSIALTGWTLDNVGVKQVELWRDLQPGETTPPGNSTPGDPRNGKIFISNATFVDNARPDVEGLNSTIPANYRAGWGYLMLTWGLFGQGNGTYKFYAFGVDQENNTATIGAKTVVISNNTATKPFGSIDTPGIGGNPGTTPNFGWGLTPKVGGVATCKIPANGVQVSIDSGPLQPVVYGTVRSDIAGAFTGFSNSAAAGGHFIFDWATLTNGAHTIGWLITDDCNRAEGVGSRFFTVTTGTNLLADATAGTFGPGTSLTAGVSSASIAAESESPEPITVARGFGELPEIVTPGEAGSRTIEVKQGERIEVRLPRGFATAFQLVAGQRRALPTGATWDDASGILYWQPAAGFLGRYRIVFSNGSQRISVRIVVVPRALPSPSPESTGLTAP